MITYFDASSLVKCFIEEEGSAEIRTLIADSLPTTSRLSAIEIASAICRRCREGQVTEVERNDALDRLDEVMAELYVVELTPAITASAQELLRHHPLRAGDAIQLASFLAVRARTGANVRFSAFDNRLVESAQRAIQIAENRP